MRKRTLKKVSKKKNKIVIIKLKTVDKEILKRKKKYQKKRLEIFIFMDGNPDVKA